LITGPETKVKIKGKELPFQQSLAHKL